MAASLRDNGLGVSQHGTSGSVGSTGCIVAVVCAANAAGREPRAFRAPSILRFATDAFMPEYMAVLQNQPGRLGEWLARPEKWQQPSAQPAPIEQLPPLLRRLERLRLATATPLNAAEG